MDRLKHQCLLAAMYDSAKLNTDQIWTRVVSENGRITLEYGVRHSDDSEECKLGEYEYSWKDGAVYTLNTPARS